MSTNPSMVKSMVTQFKDKGLDILYADCEGYPDPTEIQEVKPDVVGWDAQKELYHIGMVADSDTVSSDSAEKKLKILAGQMMGVGTSEGKRLPFYLGYPKDAETVIDNKLQEIDQQTKENVVKVAV
ncbi:MAG: hypothetical protein R3327_01835 [Nitrosopumilaceae archaeon]|nr:hypothetical protein [Nitrosopumilaceae archaeon]